MKVKNFMTSDLIVYDINSSLNELANIMKKYDIGFVPIANKNKIVGVLTDRDIVTRILANNDNKIDGTINIRWNLSESMKKFGGNIGYGIRPIERRKEYNKINLYLGLIEAKK